MFGFENAIWMWVQVINMSAQTAAIRERNVYVNKVQLLYQNDVHIPWIFVKNI